MLVLVAALLVSSPVGVPGAASALPQLELRARPLPDLPDEGARWPVLATRGPVPTAGGSDELVALWTVARGEGQALRSSRWEAGSEGEPGAWSAPRTWIEAPSLFVNWADFPQLALRLDGAAVVTYLERLGAGTYAYGVRVLAGEAGWVASEPRWLHDDRSETEHGFVSLVPLFGGSAVAVWLDGRATKEGGAMSLRAAVLDAAGRPGSSQLLDARVCDCCQTDAVLLADGRVLVAWRDRSEDEVRDVSWSLGRPNEGEWSAPRTVREDGWKIPGCPVNGPAVCASGAGAAIAWFTLEGGERPAVYLARSRTGVELGAPLRIDAGRPLGRVDLAALADGTLIVAWLEGPAGAAHWCARAVGASGALGAVLELAEVSGERTDGFLRLARHGDGVACAFVDGERGRVVVVERAFR